MYCSMSTVPARDPMILPSVQHGTYTIPIVLPGTSKQGACLRTLTPLALRCTPSREHRERKENRATPSSVPAQAMSGKTVTVLMRVALKEGGKRSKSIVSKEALGQGRQRGVCTEWQTGQGFGFVLGENSKSTFAHHSSVDRDGYRALRVGELVSFEYESRRDQNGRWKNHAVRIRTVDGERLAPLGCKLDLRGRPVVEVDSYGHPIGDGDGKANGLAQLDDSNSIYEATLSERDAQT